MATMYGYGRASTDKQQITLESQKHICESYYQLRKAAGDEYEWGGWHPDAAVSAKLYFPERPMGERLMMRMRQGDCLVVSNFDRLFRSVIDCDNTIKSFNERKLKVSIQDVGIDTNTPTGASMMKLIAVLKEMERETIAARTSSALQQKIRSFKPCNRHAPYGWKKVGTKGEGRFTPDEKERAWGYEIVKLRELQQMSFRQITKYLKKNHRIEKRPCKWPPNKVILVYVATKCGFPRVPTKTLPMCGELLRYLDANDDRPPLLEASSYTKGFLHTVPPNPDVKTVSFAVCDP